MQLLALVTDAFGGSGGIARYNCDLLQALVQGGAYRHVVVLPRRADMPGETPPGIRQLPPLGQKSRYAVAALATAARARFDGVFCGHIHLAPLAAVVAAVCGAPLWLQLHGAEAWRRLPPGQAWAAARARLITAVSRHTRREFIRVSGIDPACVRILPNTFGDHFAPGPKPAALVDRYRLHGRQVLLTVGRLSAAERGKGHDGIIAALARLMPECPDLVYLVVGDGDDRHRLQQLAAKAGLGARVVFAGAVPGEELPDHYRVADAFAMPSVQEGFGIVFLEAAASGLRPIGGNRDGSLDALADGEIGDTVDPGCPDALARAITAVLARGRGDGAAPNRYRFASFAQHACSVSAAALHRAAG